MKTRELKVARIGNSRGVRLPASSLKRYSVGSVLIMEERADGRGRAAIPSLGSVVGRASQGEEATIQVRAWSRQGDRKAVRSALGNPGPFSRGGNGQDQTGRHRQPGRIERPASNPDDLSGHQPAPSGLAIPAARSMLRPAWRDRGRPDTDRQQGPLGPADRVSF
jgi:hypothetical protein